MKVKEREIIIVSLSFKTNIRIQSVYEKPQLALILQEIGQLKDKYGLLEQINEKLNDLFVQLKLKNSIEERKHELQVVLVCSKKKKKKLTSRICFDFRI